MRGLDLGGERRGEEPKNGLPKVSRTLLSALRMLLGPAIPSVHGLALSAWVGTQSLGDFCPLKVLARIQLIGNTPCGPVTLSSSVEGSRKAGLI